MRSYFETLERSISEAIHADPTAWSANKVRAREVARLGVRLYSETERIAWCGISTPFPLLHAMGVTPCFVEFIGAMLASTAGADPAIVEAERMGLHRDACGYHRAVLGAARLGLMPVPDLLVAASTPCTGGVAVLENLARHFHRELFVMSFPYRDGPEAEAFLVSQLQALLEFLSRRTGRPIDWDAIAQAVRLSNEASELLDEVYRLGALVPSPLTTKDLANFGIVIWLFMGRPEAVDIARAYRDELRARVVAGPAPDAPPERRLLWVQNRIQFRTPIFGELEASHGAVVVTDEFNWVWWEPVDPADPLPGLARQLLRFPLAGPLQGRLEHIARLARFYRVHGAVNPVNFGCRQAAGARSGVQETLGALGVPVLNLEVDCVDRRNWAEGQVRTRLEAFLEMLAERPSPWEAAGRDGSG